MSNKVLLLTIQILILVGSASSVSNQVNILNTNSPLQDGDELQVDVQVENTGSVAINPIVDLSISGKSLSDSKPLLSQNSGSNWGVGETRVYEGGSDHTVSDLDDGVYHIDVYGAGGGKSDTDEGGSGGFVDGNIDVSSADELYIQAGGSGGAGPGSQSGGGGGGASYVRLNSDAGSNQFVGAGGGAGAKSTSAGTTGSGSGGFGGGGDGAPEDPQGSSAAPGGGGAFGGSGYEDGVAGPGAPGGNSSGGDGGYSYDPNVFTIYNGTKGGGMTGGKPGGYFTDGENARDAEVRVTYLGTSTLSPGQTEQVTLTATLDIGTDDGSYNAKVQSLNDQDTANIEINAFNPDISNLDTNAPIDAGEQLVVDVEVKNTGSNEGKSPIDFSLGKLTSETSSVPQSNDGSNWGVGETRVYEGGSDHTVSDLDDGVYHIDVYGAGGGIGSDYYEGGSGGFVNGNIDVGSGDEFYIRAGGGGGAGRSSQGAGGGGGASYVRLNSDSGSSQFVGAGGGAGAKGGCAGATGSGSGGFGGGGDGAVACGAGGGGAFGGSGHEDGVAGPGAPGGNSSGGDGGYSYDPNVFNFYDGSKGGGMRGGYGDWSEPRGNGKDAEVRVTYLGISNFSPDQTSQQTFTYTSSSSDIGSYNLEISSISDSVSRSVEIQDGTNPTISSISPEGDISTESPTISADFNDNYELSYYYLDIDGGQVSQGSVAGTSDSVSYSASGLSDGSHTYTWTAYDTADNTDSDSGTFTVNTNDPPSASFVSDSPVLTNEDFGLDASGSTDPDGDSLVYEWDTNGDGVYGDKTGVNPSVNKSDNGSFSIGLRGSDGNGGTDTITKTVEVENREPSASFSSDDPKPTDSSINFDASGSTDPDGSINLYEWDVNNDGSYENTGSTITHSYPQNGEYDVNLLITDDDGATDTVTNTITVENRKPTVSISKNDSDSLTGEDISFDADAEDSDGSVEIYNWDTDGDGNYDDGSGSSVVESFADDGEYIVSVRVTDDDSATSTADKTVNIKNRDPTADFTEDSPKKTDESIGFDASDSSDADGDIEVFEWDWDDDGEYESTGESVSYSFSDYGSFSVKLKVTDDDGGIDTTERTVEVENREPSVGSEYPEDGRVGLSTSPELNVSVIDPEGNNTNVTFLDGSGNSVIGEETDVENDSVASIEWNGLSENETYSWYVNVTDGVDTKSSNTFDFSTVSEPDNPVVSVSDGETVSVDSSLKTNVSHPDGDMMMVEMTVTDSDGDFVDDYTQSNIGNEEITWNDPNLGYDEDYRLNVEASVPDSEGEIYSSSKSIDFQTEIPPEDLVNIYTGNLDVNSPELKFDFADSIDGMKILDEDKVPIELISDPKDSETVELSSELDEDKEYSWSVIANRKTGSETLNFNFTTITVDIDLNKTIDKASTYRIYRAESKDKNYSQVDEESLEEDDSTLVDSSKGLEKGKTYCYKVTAVSDSGLESDRSSSMCLKSQTEVTNP